MALAAGLLTWGHRISERECRLVNNLRRWELSEPIPMLIGIRAIRLQVQNPETWPTANFPYAFAKLEHFALERARKLVAEMNAATEVQVLSPEMAAPGLQACDILDVEIAFRPYRNDRALDGDEAGAFFITERRPPLLGIKQGKSICASGGIPSDVMPNGPWVPLAHQLELDAIRRNGEEVIRRLVDHKLIDYIYLASSGARNWVGQRVADCRPWLH